MSKITSSRGPTGGNQPMTAKSSTRVKALTDFSIDTLIGLPDCSPGEKTHDDYCQDCEQNQSIQTMQTSKLRSPERTSTTTSDTRTPTSVQSMKKYRPKNFQCPACKMAFSNNGQLKNHVRIHTGERPFTCNYPDCNKTFTRNEELTRHKLIHTGVRPHLCTCCGKRFGRKDHLKKHIRTHERKRMRKKVFVPMETIKSITEKTTSKEEKLHNNNNNKEEQHSRLSTPTDDLNTQSYSRIKPIPPPKCHVQTTAHSIIPIVSLPYQLHPSIPITATTTTTSYMRRSAPAPHLQPPPPAPPTSIRSLTPTTANTIQQIASDYWQKWYSFMGLYQHQHQHQQQPCTNSTRFGDMFRR